MDISENVMAETIPERGNELKAILFKFLLEEYAHQNEYLITLLELFLVHFYHSNERLKKLLDIWKANFWKTKNWIGAFQ